MAGCSLTTVDIDVHDIRGHKRSHSSKSNPQVFEWLSKKKKNRVALPHYPMQHEILTLRNPAHPISNPDNASQCTYTTSSSVPLSPLPTSATSSSQEPTPNRAATDAKIARLKHTHSGIITSWEEKYSGDDRCGAVGFLGKGNLSYDNAGFVLRIVGAVVRDVVTGAVNEVVRRWGAGVVGAAADTPGHRGWSCRIGRQPVWG